MTTRLIADILLVAAGLGVLATWLIAAETALWLIRNRKTHGGRKVIDLSLTAPALAPRSTVAVRTAVRVIGARGAKHARCGRATA